MTSGRQKYRSDRTLRCPRCGWRFTVYSVPNGDVEPLYAEDSVEWFCPHCGSGVRGGSS